VNKNDYPERPHIEKVWEDFDFRVLMCGMGDDTAMLIAELYVRGLEPDELVFCDTGSEFPHTYEFIQFLKKWTIEKKWSKVVVLKKLDKFKKPLSVISLCKDQSTLPNAAFGEKTCSLRFKTETADLYFNNHKRCWRAWGVRKKGVRTAMHTGKILRMVGINADEPRRVASWKNQPKWTQVFPLFDWGVGERESENVEKIGLYYPAKSSCTICPNMTHPEIAMLRDEYPKLYQQALDIELAYQKKFLVDSGSVDLFGKKIYENTVMGLGGVKGKTWGQMMREYDDEPRRYKRMSANHVMCSDCGH